MIAIVNSYPWLANTSTALYEENCLQPERIDEATCPPADTATDRQGLPHPDKDALIINVREGWGIQTGIRTWCWHETLTKKYHSKIPHLSEQEPQENDNEGATQSRDKSASVYVAWSDVRDLTQWQCGAAT